MTEEKVTLRDVVFDKMNVLENHFIKGDHLDPKYKDTIKDQMAWIKKMWIVVGEDDREWIENGRYGYGGTTRMEVEGPLWHTPQKLRRKLI